VVFLREDKVLKKQINKSGSHYSLDVAVHGRHHVATAATAPLPPQLHAGPARTTQEEENNSIVGPQHKSSPEMHMFPRLTSHGNRRRGVRDAHCARFLLIAKVCVSVQALLEKGRIPVPMLVVDLNKLFSPLQEFMDSWNVVIRDERHRVNVVAEGMK
jgi:hypothetical protein